MLYTVHTRPQFQIAKITKKGVEISDSQSVDTYWGFAEKLRGYA
jgi:hypothetical protein